MRSAAPTLPEFPSPHTVEGAELFQLIYVSSAVVPFSEAELLSLLETSRARNVQVGVTGLLLYCDGNFVQALEGSETAVRAVHERIMMDRRHRGCITLIQAPISSRTFDGWSMGFRHLDSGLLATQGYSDFLNRRDRPDAPTVQPNRAWQLLTSFRRGLR